LDLSGCRFPLHRGNFLIFTISSDIADANLNGSN